MSRLFFKIKPDLVLTGTEYGIESKNITNCDPETGIVLRYGHVEDYEAVFSRYHHRIAAVMMEAIHGTLK